ncbi:MAG: citrate/2-methylcitrate synthase [Acidimicrobiales bacterium]|nr:citrate/2-methylcitrate synthase [Acidimicrobiales bacterium]
MSVPDDERISAAEAASRLGVKRETIYAYVSRGLLHSKRHLDGKSSTFDPAEIDRFRRRKADDRPGRLEVPVASGITEVLDGSVRLRGHSIGDLVDAGHSYESVAELLWTSTLTEPVPWTPSAPVARAVRKAGAALPSHATPTDRMMAGVVAAGAVDPFRDDRSVAGATATARQLIRAIVDSLPTDHDVATDRIAQRLWVRLTDADERAWPALQTAMVILADHGMATSTLAARLAASTRAAPHAIVLAGLGAVAGPLHGAASRTVHLLFADAEASGPDAAIAEVMRRDGRVPGIGHFIHRERDPRHDILFDALADLPLDGPRMDVVASVVARTTERIPAAPNVDLALGALTYISGMSPNAGEVIFAIARTAGWIAHALEEYEETPIRFRPVGRYVDPVNRRPR